MSAETLPGPAPTDPHAEHRRPLPAGAPSRIGRYEVLREIGTGTFGRVYYAHDPVFRRYVAVKVPKEPLAPDRHDDFLREARLIVGIPHQNICPVYDADVRDGTPYIVMRYVGSTLDELLKTGPLAPDRALDLAQQVARALDAAHTKDVIHRDLKPSNLLYDASSGQLLLADFGIARVLTSATVTIGGSKGTPLYMAPEQWEEKGEFGLISARTDVYSLGCLLYQMLTGKPPFVGTQYQLLKQHMDNDPPAASKARLGLDSRYDELPIRAMQKQQAKRYPSAAEFGSAIDRCARGETRGSNSSVEVALSLFSPPVVPLVSPVYSTSRAARLKNTINIELAPSTVSTFCWIPPGECQLGCLRGESTYADERDIARGRFRTSGFWLGKFPVTQAEWEAVMQDTALARPSWFRAGSARGGVQLNGITDSSRFPVERVSWKDCQAFLTRVSAHNGLRSLPITSARFVLPHEDEWEYACRGGFGNHLPYYFGTQENGSRTNCDGRTPYGTTVAGTYLGRTSAVGDYETNAPHPWGLCDMHGNVWEWCANEHSRAEVFVMRGGSWGHDAEHCRSAARGRGSAGDRSFDFGLRLCIRPG